MEREFVHHAYVIAYTRLANGDVKVTRRWIPAGELYRDPLRLEQLSRGRTVYEALRCKPYEQYCYQPQIKATIHRQAEWKRRKPFESGGENRISARASLKPSRLLMRLSSFI
jgi:hypothetical protein